MIYLDNAATSARKPLPVLGSTIKNTITKSVNAGRGGHRLSLAGIKGVIGASESLARLFHIDNPDRIAFTQNATYALNMAIHGVAAPGAHIIVTQMDHNSVLRPAYQSGNYTVVLADAKGYVHPQDIQAAIRPDTRLIVCTHVSNVCGSIQPIEEIGAIAKSHGIPFLLDASQSAGCMEVNVQKLGADLMACSGHKGLMGPLGTGLLYVAEGITLRPLITGGTGSLSESLSQPDFMPDLLQSGTMNTPAIIALGRAAEFVRAHDPQAIQEREAELAKDLIADLNTIRGVTVYGEESEFFRNGTVAFNIDHMDCGMAAEILDERFDIAVRAGYHCAPLAHRALGTHRTGCIRASFGFYNRRTHEKALCRAVSEIAGQR